ncbi:MAG: GGDEF domain-containing protein [Pseudomonadota bacterium]|nr:GGDEF domain-containing protein [Pseudomonadota bacterium]
MDIESLIEASDRARLAGNHVLGADLATEALDAAAATPQQRARAQALIAVHGLRLGDPERAVREGERALAHFIATQDLAAQANVQSNLACVYLDIYLPQQALAHAIAALDAARRSGNRHAECWALNRTAAIHEVLGNITGAVDFGRRALALAQGLADEEAIFASMINLATSELRLADDEAAAGLDPQPTQVQALCHIEESIEVHAGGNAHREGFARTRLVRALEKVGRYDEALVQLASALALAAHNGFRTLLLEGRVLQGKLLAAQGQTPTAIEQLESLLAQVDGKQDPVIRAEVHALLHALHKQSGGFEQALAHHEALHRYKLQEVEQTASLQSRILLNRFELDEAHHQAERARLDAEMQRMRAEALDREAHTDALTGLLNRRFLDRQLPRLMRRAGEIKEPLTAALIDIDHFKLVNDTHGHAVGDRVLVELAMLLRQTTRGADLALRLGGEEFLLVLPDTTPERAVEACERLRQQLQHHHWDALVPGLSCTVSIGLGHLQPAEDAAAWMRRLDDALYAAKRGGRNRVVLAEAVPCPECRAA